MRPMKRPPLGPMVQGGLDSLCGLYSAVNAIRWVLGGNPAGLTAEDVFAVVVSRVDRVADAGAALTQGIEPPHLHRALTRTLDVLRGDHATDLVAALPFAKRRRTTFAEVRSEFADDLRAGGIAYIVVFGGRLNHWSVVRGVTAASLLLFDSAGHRRIPLDRCRMEGEANGDRSRHHVLDRRGIIRLGPGGRSRTPPDEPDVAQGGTGCDGEGE